MAHENGNGRTAAVARGLGWFSVALGTAQVAAPRRVARAIGLDGGRTHARTMRLVGARELATGAGILASRRPAGWMWARVAGDAMDLALLVAADPRKPARTNAAIAAVAATMASDLVEGLRQTGISANGAAANGRGIRVRKAITVARDPGEVYATWRQLTNLPHFMAHLDSVEAIDDTRSRWRAKGPAGVAAEWEAEIVDDQPGRSLSWRSLPGSTVETQGSVRFVPAPGDRGTEVIVELDYRPPAGAVGAGVAKLLGEEPSIQLSDDLRRFKQMLEVGEVVRSEKGGSR